MPSHPLRGTVVMLLAVGLCVGALGASATGSAHRGAAGGQKVYAPEDCVQPRVKPSRIVIACGDFGLWVSVVNWAKWNDPGAKGRGFLKSVGPKGIKKYKVKVRLKGKDRERCGGRRVQMYQRMILHFPHRRPAYHDSIPKQLFCVP